MTSNGACRTVPHAPFPAVRTPAEGRRLLVLIQHPLPEVRAQGMRAWDDGQSRSDNRYNSATQPAEWANWDAGWNDRMAQNS